MAAQVKAMTTSIKTLKEIESGQSKNAERLSSLINRTEWMTIISLLTPDKKILCPFITLSYLPSLPRTSRLKSFSTLRWLLKLKLRSMQ